MVSLITSLAAGVWGLWHVRLRHVRQRFSWILGERARLSRELHDTLVQSLVGMSLQLDAIATAASSSSPDIQQQLVRMRSQVDEYLREARQSIWELRTPMRRERPDLVVALRELGERLVAGLPIRFELSVSGSQCRCGQNVEEQLLRISKEAITNVIRHARASTVHVSVHYERTLVVLTVSDDGCGFDLAARTSRKSDRYGLIGLKERAVEVGGELDVTSRIGRGTEIRVSVPIVRESQWRA
jgi:signal transduction histidine kinase